MLTGTEEEFSPMRAYAAAHRLARRSLLLLPVAVLLVLWPDYAVEVPTLSGGSTVVTAPVARFCPLLLACVVALCAVGPMEAFTRTAARPQCRARCSHVLGALAVVLAVAAFALLIGGAPGHLPAVTRNLAGYTGLALLAVTLWGPSLGWVLPLAYLLPAYLLGTAADGGTRWWAWPVAVGADVGSWVVALLLLGAGWGCSGCVGLGSAVRRRQGPGTSENLKRGPRTCYGRDPSAHRLSGRCAPPPGRRRRRRPRRTPGPRRPGPHGAVRTA
ncbi:hypothetical protein [Streptomyces sp. MST-110588]|uniref:hypothetical protein n=1 Tax=Streptomyces sp. MST-110588 TaxID=2833628 RepID=UPI001F5D7374|nr:hypothetical protein [Streptomyces sp. MST-110588]UNO42415.1 hypothetical protein KGS77_26450 [Streptomyces sp. MST-110588]